MNSILGPIFTCLLVLCQFGCRTTLSRQSGTDNIIASASSPSAESAGVGPNAIFQGAWNFPIGLSTTGWVAIKTSHHVSTKFLKVKTWLGWSGDCHFPIKIEVFDALTNAEITLKNLGNVDDVMKYAPITGNAAFKPIRVRFTVDRPQEPDFGPCTIELRSDGAPETTIPPDAVVGYVLGKPFTKHECDTELVAVPDGPFGNPICYQVLVDPTYMNQCKALEGGVVQCACVQACATNIPWTN